MSEEAYLDALEALEAGERERAAELAQQIVEDVPDHASAWALLSEALMPGKQGQRLDLTRTARAIAATRKAVLLDPRRTDLWIRGAHLMRSIGCWEDALAWWQDARHHMPYEALPLVEQATILADLGLYDEAAERLACVVEDNMDVGASQNARIMALMGLVNKAATKERDTLFRPWEAHHDGWAIVRMRMTKPPISETTIFLLTVGPALLLLVLAARDVSSSGWSGLCLVSLATLTVSLVGVRLSRRWHQQVNRPALNLLRAMDVEVSSGYVVIPEDIRLSKLYMTLLQRTPPSYQERALKITERARPWPKGHRPRLPDFDSHLDEIGTIEDEEDPHAPQAYDEEEEATWSSEEEE